MGAGGSAGGRTERGASPAAAAAAARGGLPGRGGVGWGGGGRQPSAWRPCGEASSPPSPTSTAPSPSGEARAGPGWPAGPSAATRRRQGRPWRAGLPRGRAGPAGASGPGPDSADIDLPKKGSAAPQRVAATRGGRQRAAGKVGWPFSYPCPAAAAAAGPPSFIHRARGWRSRREAVRARPMPNGSAAGGSTHCGDSRGRGSGLVDSDGPPPASPPSARWPVCHHDGASDCD